MRFCTALFVLLVACGDDAPIETDAGVDCQEPQPGWRSCSWPYIEGDDCREVCCEYEDTHTDQNGQVFCAVTKRLCTPPF